MTRPQRGLPPSTSKETATNDQIPSVLTQAAMAALITAGTTVAGHVYITTA